MTIRAIDIYESARLILRDKDSQRYKMARFADALNEAWAETSNNLDYVVKTLFTSIPPNYNSINLANRATNIIRVEYNDVERNDVYKLDPTGFERLDREFPQWRRDSAVEQPRFVVVNRQNDCEFFVYPMARKADDETVPLFGVLENQSGELNITDDFGVIEALNVPYLEIRYAERPKQVAANEDETQLVFAGTTEIATFEIQADLFHCLKHHCVATLLADDRDTLRQRVSANHLALYQKSLQDLKQKKMMNYNQNSRRGYYNNGFDQDTTIYGGYYGRGYYG